MSDMCLMLSVVCMIAIPIMLVIFIIKAVRKKEKKKLGMAVIIVFILSIVLLVISIATSCQHPNKKLIETVEPTCTEEGYTLYHCDDCNSDVKTDYVEAAGHYYAEKERTETAIKYECSVCGDIKEEAVEEDTESPETGSKEQQEPIVETSQELESGAEPLSELQYGYFYDNEYAVVIEHDDDFDADALYLFMNGVSEYQHIYTGYIYENEDETYKTEDEIAMIQLSFYEGGFVDVDVINSADPDIVDAAGTYELREADQAIKIPSGTLYIENAEELKEFARDNSNIGKTIQFTAEVGGNYSQMGEYLLYCYTKDHTSFMQIRASADGINLFDGDVIVYTGVFNGFTGGGNQLSFITVSIELQ